MAKLTQVQKDAKMVVRQEKAIQNNLLKAAQAYLVSKGVDPKVLQSKASRFSRVVNANQTPYGTYQKVLGQYGKFYDYGGLSYTALRLISQRALLIRAIHAVRCQQILSIASPIRDPKKDIGWHIVHDRQYDKEYEVSEKEQKRAKELEMWLMTPHTIHEPNFSDFCRRFMEEHLSINRVAIELMYDRSDELQAFALIDGALVEPTFITVKKYIDDHANDFAKINNLARREIALGKLRDKFKADGIDPATVDYIYFVDQIPQAAFTAKELMLVQTNVPVDIKMYGFPASKVEDAIQGVTQFLNMMAYNDRAFTGTMIDTILGVTGDNVSPETDTMTVIEEQLQSFQGVQNAFRVPIFELFDGADIKAIQLGRGNKDMMYDKLLMAATSFVCSVYRMDTKEINMKGFASDGGGLYEANQDYAMQLAKEEGFGAESKLFADTMTKIIKLKDPDYWFEFFGLDREDRKKKLEAEQLEYQTRKGTNELRLENGEDEIDEDYCKEHGIPLGILPYLWLPGSQGLQIALGQILMAEQQKEQQAHGGQPGTEGEEGQEDEEGGQEPEEGDTTGEMGLGDHHFEGTEGDEALENPEAELNKGFIGGLD